MKKNEEIYLNDGVLLLRNVIDKEKINSVRERYDLLDKQLDNRVIPKDRPCIVFWRHVVGEQKRIADFTDFPELWTLITEEIVPIVRNLLSNMQNGAQKRPPFMQLLETVVFDKPPEVSNTLHWHQDVAYFPVQPNNQIAVWIPFQPVTRNSGAMQYALGSHKKGIRGSTNLHTREPYENEERTLIPEDPRAEGLEVACMEMNPTDMLIHDGYTWHCSGPNKAVGIQRRGLSVRFMREAGAFDPRPGQGAAFTHQIDIEPGDVIRGLPFPPL